MGIFKQSIRTVLKAWVVLVLLAVSLEAVGQESQWCLKTDQGQYIEMARVVMLAAVDGQDAFEVVVSEGQGAVGVRSITFELHESDYVAPEEGMLPVITETGPWCMITDQGDSIAMSRVQLLANVDGTNRFEIITSDGANHVDVTNVRFGRGKSSDSGGFKPITGGSTPSDPNWANPWCMITDRNDTIAMSRVLLLANVDGQGRFEIVTKEGDNRLDVSFVRFAHGDSKTAGGFKPITAGTTPSDPNAANPWCMITDRNDSIAMSRVQMIANVDGDNSFEVITADGHNVAGIAFVRFAHGNSMTSGGFQEIHNGERPPYPEGDGPWCMITDRGDSIAVSRVQLLANVDQEGTFEVVTRDGVGAVGVRNVHFARGTSADSGGFYPIDDKPEESGVLDGELYMVTNAGAEEPLSNVAMLANIDANGKFEVVLHAGINYTGVDYVTFVVKNGGMGIETPREPVNTLILQTPVRFELKLSGCGDATDAVVYDLRGVKVAAAPVYNGTTTISVAHLPAALYIVRVGDKSLKFTKR